MQERIKEGKGKAAGKQKQASGIGAKEKDLRREMREASRVGSGIKRCERLDAISRFLPRIVDRANPHPAVE